MKKLNFKFSFRFIKNGFWERGRIPTPLGLFLVGVILLLSFFIKKKVVFFPRAGGKAAPQEVRITNVTDRSFTVSWRTNVNTTGAVKLVDGESERMVLDVREKEGRRVLGEIHYVLVEGLEADKEYFFWIYSGGKDYGQDKEGGKPFRVKTAKLFSGSPSEAKLAFGRVVDQEGKPAEGVIVYLTIPGIAPLSSLTSSQGNWVVPLAFAFNQSLTQPADYQEGEIKEEIVVEGGSRGRSRGFNYTAFNKPTGEIVLGEDFDFTQSPPPSSQEKKESRLDLPSSSLTPTKDFEVINPDEGETIYTSRPEIFGFGPSGGKVKITVESATRYEGEVEIGPDGEWRWLLPGDLSPGEHTLTVEFTDSEGKEKVVQRRFVVLAAEEGPAFTASPSGEEVSPTPTPTLTPTPTPTSTPTPTLTLTPTSTPTSSPAGRTTMPSTESGVPQTGLLTPGIISFTMGVIIIIASILWRQII